MKMEQKYSTTFEDAKIGDRVWSPTFGWGEIECLGRNNYHPIRVRFFHDRDNIGYTFKGHYYIDLPIQSLFWDEVAIVAPAKPSH
jgi:hypothetical protein